MDNEEKPDFFLEDDSESEDAPVSERRREKLRRRAMNVSMYALSQRAMTTLKLTERLEKKEIPEDIIEETLEKLKDWGMLDDAAYAQNYILSRQESKNHGKRRIALDLRQRGIPPEITEEILEEVDEDAERQRAKNLALKSARKTVGLDKQKRLRRILGLLGRNGFGGGISYPVAYEALEEVDVELEEERKFLEG